jgi:hypothetical protein
MDSRPFVLPDHKAGITERLPPAMAGEIPRGEHPFPSGDWCSPSSLKENTMFIESLSRRVAATSVLLGGSGVCQPRAKPDVGALLLPHKPQKTEESRRSLFVDAARSP